MVAVAKALSEAGVEVRFSSSREASEFIRGQGFRCNEVPLADVKYTDMGELAVKDTVVSSPLILAKTYQQVRREVGNISSFEPDAVLSDSVLSTVLAARVLGRRVVTVVNQIHLEAHGAERSARLRMVSLGASRSMRALWSLSDSVLYPDLPPPYTISERNLWGTDATEESYIGFLTMEDSGPPDSAFSQFSSDPRTKIFWQVSGPTQTRAPLVRRALELAEHLSDEYVFVITGGDPTGSKAPSRLSFGWYYSWCAMAGHYFRACDVVVARAGHGTLAQAIESSKPSLLIPIPKQTEQEGNSRKAERLGISIKVEQDELTADVFRRSLRTLNEGDFSERVARLSSIASGYEALPKIVSALEGRA